MDPRQDDKVRHAGMAGRFADYIVAARGRPAPEPARQAALRCILDLLGAAGAGIADTGVLAVRSVARATMGAGHVPVWFTGEHISATGAAWANSAASAALDLDDGHRLARGHPGAAVIPAAFAVAQETGATFEDVLTAIVIGYEVGIAIGAARTTYGNTGTWSAFAVVAAAAALRGTSRDAIEHALAIAGQSGPNQAFLSAANPDIAPEGSDVKEGIPWSVVTGLMSLGLAEAGHTGPRNLLDSRVDYRFPDDFEPGSNLLICRTYFKLYACCRHVHAPLDALQRLMHDHAITAGEIEAIEVRTYSGARRISNLTEPAHPVGIQYSIPYCLGLVAHAGPETLLPLTREALGRQDASELARKVTLVQDPELEARFPAETLCRMTIVARGQRYVSDLTSPRGEATDPLTWEELEAKLRAATRFVAAPDARDRLIDAMNTARAGDASALFTCLGELVMRPQA